MPTTMINDIAGIFPWTTKTKTKDDSGNLLRVDFLLDDGRDKSLVFDSLNGTDVVIKTVTAPNDSFSKETIETVRDLSGNLLSSKFGFWDGLEKTRTYENGLLTSTILTDASDDGSAYDFQVKADFVDTSGALLRTIKVLDNGVAVVDDLTTKGTIRIDAIHYDDAGDATGADTNQMIEVRVASGIDVSGLQLDLLNGSDGSVYDSADSADLTLDRTEGGFDYYRWSPTDIQDDLGGVAMALDGVLLEAVSYEGTFAVTEGFAAGITTARMQVFQDGTGTSDDILSRKSSGVWEGGPILNPPDAVDDVIAMSDSGLNNGANQNGDLFADNGNGFDLPFPGYTGDDPGFADLLTLVAINGFEIPENRVVPISSIDGSFSAFDGTMHANTDGTFFFYDLNETQPGGLLYEFEFTYTVENQFGARDTATAIVNYTTVSEPPRYIGPDDLLVHETAEPVPVFQLTGLNGTFISYFDLDSEIYQEAVIVSLPTNGTIVDGNGAEVSVNAVYGFADLADLFDLRFVPDDVTGNVDSTFEFRLTDENGGTQIQTLDIRVTDDLETAGNIWDLVAGGSGDDDLPLLSYATGGTSSTKYGSAGQDTLTAETYSTEVFNGGSGDDTIVLAAEGSGLGGVAFAPADILIFRDGTGTDTVINAVAGNTIFDLRGFDFTSKQDVLDAATQVGDDLHIALDLDDTIILQDRDITFFDSATTTTFADVLQNDGLSEGQLLIDPDLDAELIDAPIIIE
jgi:hypothetical protein